MRKIGPLLNVVRGMFDRGENEALLEYMSNHWDTKPAWTDELGEACRLARVAAVILGRVGPKHLWDARALAIFTISRSYVGIAALVMNKMYVVASVAGEPGGRARLDEALPILDEMLPLLEAAPPDSIPEIDLGWRLYHEKRAWLTWELGRFEDAVAGYARALQHTADDERGSIKVRAAIALCLACTGDIAEARRSTQKELELAKVRGYDLTRKLEANLQVMHSKDHGFTPADFTPYETR
jgi:hypothetical protein